MNTNNSSPLGGGMEVGVRKEGNLPGRWNCLGSRCEFVIRKGPVNLGRMRGHREQQGAHAVPGLEALNRIRG